MARPRKNDSRTAGLPVPPHLAAWAETLGEALGRGVARGIQAGLQGVNLGSAAGAGSLSNQPRRRGRPPKAPAGPVPPERQCQAEGCEREARSKGLCSAHYQQERRKALQKSGA